MIVRIVILMLSLVTCTSGWAAGKTAAHPDFVAAFKTAEKAIRAGDYAKAGEKFDDIAGYREKSSLRPYEEAHYQLLLYWLSEKSGNKQAEYDALKTLIHTGARLIDDEIYVPASVSLFRTQLEMKAYGDALVTYEKAQKLKAAVSEFKKYKSIVSKLEAIAESKDPLVWPAEVDKSGTWSRVLLRPGLYLDSVDGNVSKYELDCEKKDLDIPFQEGGTLSIPASFGRCELTVHAEPATKFELVQFTPESGK